MAPARRAAAAASLRRRLRMPVKARCTPFSVRSLPAFSGAGGWRRASISSSARLVPLPPLADAAVDDLLQVVAAGEPRGSRRCGSVPARRPSPAFRAAGPPGTRRRAPATSGRRRRRCRSGPSAGSGVRRSIPRRSLCCRTMPEVPELQAAALADEHVHRREVAVEHLAAVQLPEHLEDARDLAPRGALGPPLAGAVQERPAGRRGARTRGPGSTGRAPSARTSGKLSKTRIARGWPSSSCPKYASRSHAVDALADLDADGRGDDARAPEPPGEIDLAEPALAEQSFDAVLQAASRGWR